MPQRVWTDRCQVVTTFNTQAGTDNVPSSNLRRVTGYTDIKFCGILQFHQANKQTVF